MSPIENDVGYDPISETVDSPEVDGVSFELLQKCHDRVEMAVVCIAIEVRNCLEGKGRGLMGNTKGL